MTRLSKAIYFFSCLLFFVAFDFFVSDLILNNIYSIEENPIIDLIFIQNEGASFNILQGSKVFLIVFSLFALVLIIVYVIKNLLKLSTMAVFFTSMLCAGIFSNMSERIIFGYVRDYIKLKFIDFPIFNISDIFINISVFAIVLVIIRNNYIKQNENSN